jgi:Tol biopolymer transport system component
VIDADGSGATNVSNDPAADTDPVWSPDGTRIAFVRAGEGHTNIWVMNADGTGQVNLTPGPFATGTPACPDSNGGYGVNPTWSPDGRRIAYASNGEIMVMNADGRGKTSLSCTAGSVTAESQPAWGANGQIAYVRGNDVWTMDGAGGRQRPLTATNAGEQAPDWSPTADRLAYTRAGQVWVMNADGSAQTAVTGGSGEAGTLPAWSPDGQKLVFSSNAFTAPIGHDLFVMNPDGSGVTRLFGAVPAAELDPSWQPAATSLPTASIGDASVTESQAGTVDAVFSVMLSRPSSTTVSVAYATADGTARAGKDYVAASGVVTFAPGETRARSWCA